MLTETAPLALMPSFVRCCFAQLTIMRSCPMMPTCPASIQFGLPFTMLVIFIGIFGGLFNWGFLGLFIGPLILSVGIFLLDIYKTINAEQFDENNPFE